jgi:phage terminase small subunit
MSERTRYVSEVLAEAVEKTTSDQARLEHGLKVREQIHAALQRGETPDHPRFAWLQAQAKALLDLVFMMGADFDKANPTDKCSVADLCDILDIARNRLEQVRREQAGSAK